MTFIAFVIIYCVSWAMMGMVVARKSWFEDYVNSKDGVSVEVGVEERGLTSLEVGVEAMAKGVGAGGKFFLMNRLLFGT